MKTSVRRLAAFALALALASALLNMQPASPVYAATFMVTNTNDTGPGSLRDAITKANATSKKDTIRFKIPGPPPHTITLASQLPDITRPVVIDGTSQPSFPGTLGVRLNGDNLITDGLRLVAGSNGSAIKGLVIIRFTTSAIFVNSSSKHTIQGNYIGVADGVSTASNSYGVYLANSDNILIGGTAPALGNLISGNSLVGVVIAAGSSGNRVQGNRIGTDNTGKAALGNGGDGILIDSSPGNTIGGATAGAGNLVSGNGDGIYVSGSAASGNVIQGNFIGTDITGALDLGNGSSGITLANTPDNVVGGTTAGARNVISGNDGSGILISGSTATGNVVLGNFIGSDVTGTSPLGNSLNGMFINNSASNNVVGGAAPGAGNLITSNAANGVTVTNSVLNSVIQRNRIQNHASSGLVLGSSSTIATNTMNCFQGNLVGMTNSTATNTNAINNWWGAADGPGAPGGSGSGDPVSANVDFTPFAATSCDAVVNDRVNNGGMEVNANADLLPDGWIGKGLKLTPANDGRACGALGANGSDCAFRFVGNNKLKTLTQTINIGGLAAEDITLSLYSQEDTSRPAAASTG